MLHLKDLLLNAYQKKNKLIFFSFNSIIVSQLADLYSNAFIIWYKCDYMTATSSKYTTFLYTYTDEMSKRERDKK